MRERGERREKMEKEGRKEMEGEEGGGEHVFI